jgi:KUP system potassium uptake protein
MVALVALVIWRINIFIVSFVFLTFALLDGLYLSSAVTKVPDGAWFTLLLAFILSAIFVLWRFGKEQQWGAESEDRFQTSHFLTTNPSGQTHLTENFGGGEISKVNGIGIFFDKVGEMTPIVFSQFIRKFSARPEIMVFFHMRPLPVPTIPEVERYLITRTSIPGCYRLTIRHGYTDDVLTPNIGGLICEQLTLYITRHHSAPADSAVLSSHSPKIQAELDILEKAKESQVVYVMGKEQMKLKKGTNIVRRVVLEAFLWMRENSRTKMADMELPVDQLVEVGFVKVI